MVTKIFYPALEVRVHTEAPYTPMEGLSALTAGKAQSGSEGRYLCTIDLSGIPKSADIVSATLNLTQYNDANDWSAGLDVDMRALNAMITGNTTWTTQPGVLAGDYVSTRISGTSARQWTLDAAEAVKKALESGIYAFRVAGVAAASSTAKYFRTYAYDHDLGPVLTVNYEGALGSVYINGWREIASAKVNIGGTWREIARNYVYTGGEWREAV